MMEAFCRDKLSEYKNFETSVVTGIPYEEIIRKAQEIDASLIVVGTTVAPALTASFSAVPRHVVRSSPHPVLSIRLPANAS